LILQVIPSTRPIHQDTPLPTESVPYKFVIGDRVIEGETEPDGTIRIEDLPPGKERAELTVYGRTTVIKIGHLDPVTDVTGLQARLRNLGFYPGAVDGDLGPVTAAAIQVFHALNDAAALGTTACPETRRRLVDLHKV
jgi:hypothetical protein